MTTQHLVLQFVATLLLVSCAGYSPENNSIVAHPKQGASLRHLVKCRLETFTRDDGDFSKLSIKRIYENTQEVESLFNDLNHANKIARVTYPACDTPEYLIFVDQRNEVVIAVECTYDYFAFVPAKRKSGMYYVGLPTGKCGHLPELAIRIRKLKRGASRQIAFF